MDGFPSDSSSSSSGFFLSFLEKKFRITPDFLSLFFLSSFHLSDISSLSNLSKLGRGLSSFESVDARGVLSSLNRLGVRVIFLVSTVSSLKNESVFLTVPFLDLLIPSGLPEIIS